MWERQDHTALPAITATTTRIASSAAIRLANPYDFRILAMHTATRVEYVSVLSPRVCNSRCALFSYKLLLIGLRFSLLFRAITFSIASYIVYGNK